MTPSESLLQADDRARSDALDVSRSFIVQAPAGSGKTELLIQRYLRLLSVVDNPEEILAITFTRKAAAEMQFRVLQALLRVRRGEAPAEAHEQVTAAAAAAALERDRDLGWRLIEYPARMKIQTLDSLNASISRMRPLTGSSAIANAIAEEAETRELYRDAAAATLDWLSEPGATCDAVEEVLFHVDNNTSTYIAYLARMLETRDQWLPFVGKGRFTDEEDRRLREQLEDNLRATVERHLERVRNVFPRDLLPDFLPLLAYAARNMPTANGGMEAVTADSELPSVQETERWQMIAELLLTQKGDWRKRVTKNQGFPAGDDGQKQSLYDVLESLGEHGELRQCLSEVSMLPPVSYSDEQWSVLRALFRLLPVAVAELQRLFSTRRLTDYIEIAIGANEALGSADNPGDVAMLLDYQLRHLLIDEMQDTSRAQYRLVEALTGGWEPGDGRTLFCVGDPMQSIYRFRNAEVAQFLLAKDAGIGSVSLEPLLLRRNFRSGDFLVHWFNTVFPMVLPASDEPAQGAVSYAEAVPGRGTEGDCKVHPVFGSDAETEAETGCRIIGTTLEQYPDDTMAVLVRSRTQLTALLAQLRAAGIAYQSVDIDRLTDLPEIIDLLALTRAFAHPCDRLAWLALLRSPWIGWSWQDLHTLVRNDTASTVWELLSNPERTDRLTPEARARLARAMPTLEAAQVVSRTESLRDRVERAWLQLGGPGILKDADAIDNVQRYLDVLERLEVAGTLRDVAELELQLDLERVSNSGGARLQIMTMHRAKGLQFDHVLLYGLGRRPRRSERSVLSWLDLPDANADEEKIIGPVGRRADLEADPIHRFIGLRESQKDNHEAGRLLYVACTRARKTLHLVGHTGVAADGESFKPPPAQSLLRLLWPGIAAEFDAGFEPRSAESGAATEDDWWQPRLQHVEPPWQLPQTSDVPGMMRDDQVSAAADPVEFYWVGSEARIAGTIVHRWLQLAADGRAKLDAGNATSRQATSRRWLRELGIEAAPSETIIRRVDAALAGVTNDPKGRWLLSGSGYTELALTGPSGNGFETGIIDRVRIDDDGTHWIVDYKTSTHEGGNLEGFLAAELDRYRSQLTRYATLYERYSGERPRCALYFPLLGEFRELPA